MAFEVWSEINVIVKFWHNSASSHLYKILNLFSSLFCKWEQSKGAEPKHSRNSDAFQCNVTLVYTTHHEKRHPNPCRQLVVIYSTNQPYSKTVSNYGSPGHGALSEFDLCILISIWRDMVVLWMQDIPRPAWQWIATFPLDSSNCITRTTSAMPTIVPKL